MNIRLVVGIFLAAAMFLAACGADSGTPFFEAADQAADTPEADPDDDFGEALADAIGAGGSGVITADGISRPIGSAVCLLDPPVEIGTVDDDGWRLLISENSTGMSVQILDPDFVQWFATTNVVLQDGSTFSGTDTFWNNGSDDTLEVSYEVTCP